MGDAGLLVMRFALWLRHFPLWSQVRHVGSETYLTTWVDHDAREFRYRCHFCCLPLSISWGYYRQLAVDQERRVLAHPECVPQDQWKGQAHEQIPGGPRADGGAADQGQYSTVLVQE